eukprot:10844439-Alexandrium_andersonii.AAC.1
MGISTGPMDVAPDQAAIVGASMQRLAGQVAEAPKPDSLVEAREDEGTGKGKGKGRGGKGKGRQGRGRGDKANEQPREKKEKKAF